MGAPLNGRPPADEIDISAHRVLVVDDNEMNRELLRFRLDGQGLEVVEAANGQEALDQLRQSCFDLVLLDVMMPIMNGMEALKVIKDDQSLQHIPVVMVSAVSEVETVAACLEQGADDYICKPFNPVLLRARVRGCLERRRLRVAQQERFDTDQPPPDAQEGDGGDASCEQLVVQRALVRALAKLIESRVAGAGSRLDRISGYSVVLAKQLAKQEQYQSSIDAKFIDRLAEASLLHDIGRALVPEQVLNKPSRLDTHERHLMQQHTHTGTELFKTLLAQFSRDSMLEMAVDIASSHHERWDGGGYPQGLRGDAIPLAARIVSVADCYDALTSRRRYKEVPSPSQGKETIEAESGAQFDPALVEAFSAAETELKHVWLQLQDPLTSR